MPINFGIFSQNQVDKWTSVTHDRLLKIGFRYCDKSVITGKSEYHLDTYSVPHLENIITPRFVFDANTSYIQDFKLLLPAKHCNSMFDVKQYILHAKYFD